MSTSIVLFTNPWSRGRMARWMLEETGLPYHVRLLDYDTSMKDPSYTQLNPMGKVPSILHGDTVVTEVAAICTYLADLVPEKELVPPVGTPERGSFYRWMFFGAGPLEAAATAKSLGLLAPIERRTSAGYGTYDDVMNTLEGAAKHAVTQGGGYLVGGRFTAADLYLGAQLNWGMQFNTIERRAAFEDYCGPIVHRQACLLSNALDDADGVRMKAAAAPEEE